MTQPILYIANKHYSSWSLRPWVLMRTLGIGFEERLVPFEGDGVQKQFQVFSPTGKVPCLVDGETTVWDSLAIIEYLAERHERVWPEDPQARAWARCASAEMHSGFSVIRGFNSMSCGLRVELREPPPQLAVEWQRADQLWCEGLSRHGGPFLGGEQFTAVDAFYAPLAFRAQTYRPQLSGQAAAYVARLLAMPAMAEWYQSALREPWRDEAHDVEVASFGNVIEDLRV